jgi:hypothetical protein
MQRTRENGQSSCRGRFNMTHPRKTTSHYNSDNQDPNSIHDFCVYKFTL